jgi:hypothetical protein
MLTKTAPVVDNVSVSDEGHRRKKVLSPAIASLMIAAGMAVASAQDMIIAPEQETVIREYITTQKVAPIEAPADVQISVGSTLPDAVELHAIDVPDVKYRFVVIGKQTVLVEPESRKIVRILD